MIGPATQRYMACADARGAIHAFVEFARTKDIQLVSNGGLFPQKLTVAETSALIDAQQGIDRAQLNSERAATRELGAECACGE
jgi:hypothetical protein